MLFASLIAALAEVRDPRRAQGQRYSMRHLVLASVRAMLAGATSYQGILTFIALQRERLNAVIGACFRRAPAVNTLRHFFLALDRDDLEAAFRRHTSAEVERQSRSKDTDAYHAATLPSSSAPACARFVQNESPAGENPRAAGATCLTLRERCRHHCAAPDQVTIGPARGSFT